MLHFNKFTKMEQNIIEIKYNPCYVLLININKGIKQLIFATFTSDTGI